MFCLTARDSLNFSYLLHGDLATLFIGFWLRLSKNDIHGLLGLRILDNEFDRDSVWQWLRTSVLSLQQPLFAVTVPNIHDCQSAADTAALGPLGMNKHKQCKVSVNIWWVLAL